LLALLKLQTIPIGSQLSLTIEAFSSVIPTIYTALFSQTAGMKYWENGGAVDITEIIIFTRALKTEERQSIETYLSKKYGIANYRSCAPV